MADPISAARAALDAQADTLAQALKEPPDAVRRAFEAAAPGALASLIGRGESDEGVIEVRTALNHAQTGPELLTTLGSRLDGVKLRGRAGGAGVRLLGGRGQPLVEQVATYAGVKPSSASTLVDLAVPVVVAGLRGRGAAPADAEEVRELLRAQAETVNRNLPAELKPRFAIVLQREPAPAGAGGGTPAWVWLAVLAAVVVIAVLAWWLLAGQAHAATPGLHPWAAVLAIAPGAERFAEPDFTNDAGGEQRDRVLLV